MRYVAFIIEKKSGKFVPALGTLVEDGGDHFVNIAHTDSKKDCLEDAVASLEDMESNNEGNGDVEYFHTPVESNEYGMPFWLSVIKDAQQ